MPSLVLRFQFRGFVCFDAIEIIELVEAQDTQFPGAFVEKLAFIDQQLAADDFVTGGGITAEVDAADVVLLLFVELQSQIDNFLVVVDVHGRFGGEVNEPVFAIGVLVILEGFAKFVGGEDVALFQRENALEGFDLEGQGFVGVGADNFQSAHVEAFPFFDGDSDVDGFSDTVGGEG